MKSFRNIMLCLAGFAASVTSCVKEDISDECTVVVAVRDKNYDNAAEAGTPLLSENLPMLSYVSIGSMVLRNRARSTGAYTVYDETVAAGELVHPIAPGRFPQGVSDVAVIGGHSSTARQYTSGQTTVTLHPDGAEGEDVYMGRGEITAPIVARDTVWLYRTKGMLIIEPVNMPADIRSVAISISGLYATADTGSGALPTYGGTVAVTKNFTTAAARFSTILAPSAGAASPLSITITPADGGQETISLEVTILRNHITLVRPTYNVATREWTLEVMVDGTWEKIDNLNITD